MRLERRQKRGGSAAEGKAYRHGLIAERCRSESVVPSWQCVVDVVMRACWSLMPFQTTAQRCPGVVACTPAVPPSHSCCSKVLVIFNIHTHAFRYLYTACILVRKPKQVNG